MIKWWENAAAGRQERVVLIQVDIGGHSAWLARATTDNFLEPCRERAKLPKLLAHELETRNYHRLFWAGDGGVFASQVDDKSNRPSKLCDAVDALFRAFHNWKRRKNIEIRVTATIADLIIDPDPGNWCSPALNSFLKYERLLARPNAFVITQELRISLDVKAEFDRFPQNASKKIYLPDGNVVTIFIDKKHRPKLVHSNLAFGAWLRSQALAKSLPQISIGDRSLLRVGNCTILDYAQQLVGYGEIDLEQLEPSDPGEYLDNEDLKAWNQIRQELEVRQVSGTSLQVVQFTSELSDDPHPRLKYRTIPYKDAKAFHALLEDNQEAALRYRSRALDVLSTNGTQVPNILATAIIAIIGTNDQDIQLVIANRKPRKGGYHPNTWAVSIGEQFMPITGIRGNRVISADISLPASIVRGLREELLGENYDHPIKLSVHAFCLEDYLINGIFLAIADLRPLTFGQLKEYWHEAIDRAEHDLIAAIPLKNKDILVDCMRGEKLPEHVWTTITTEGLYSFAPGIDSISANSHFWQPNSHVRLALAHWFLCHVK